MLFSIALVLLVGMLAGWLFSKIKVPRLFGMIIAGIIIGPYVMNFLDPSLLQISGDIRKIALIIILIRAGLSLNINDLKKVGRPAVLMCFLPACFEIIGMILLAPRLLGINLIDAAIMGAVIAAVSPAVIVPKMLYLMENEYGTEQSIPQMILAGASVDDVFVIVMFSSFTGIAKGNKVSLMNFVNIPVSIVLGVAIGLLAGMGLMLFFKKSGIRDTVKIITLLCTAFLLVTLEDKLQSYIPFASLIAVMCSGLTLNRNLKNTAERLSARFNKLWIPAEIFLFVLVGATVDLTYVKNSGILVVLLIVGVLVFRMLGVFLCLFKTGLNAKERLFCMIAYTPKATVQAAIGGIPLAMGLDCGKIVLTAAVISILITAPLGAFAIDNTYKKLLEKKRM